MKANKTIFKRKKNTIFSKFLNREVVFELIYPHQTEINRKYKTIYMNDGQELDKLAPTHLYNQFYTENNDHFVWVCIYTNERRLNEYGTSYHPDYKNRGNLATDYMRFILEEMMPYVQKNTPASKKPADNYFCGFSLGGLSAIDIVWENPDKFSKSGVFSGSFWWRSKGYEEGYEEDLDRIMHNKIKESQYKPGLKFWFECGTQDETEDRNNNGIIDAIEDTLDLMDELKAKGYSEEDMVYLEVKGGEHNFNTWQAVFYDFLKWALT